MILNEIFLLNAPLQAQKKHWVITPSLAILGWSVKLDPRAMTAKNLVMQITPVFKFSQLMMWITPMYKLCHVFQGTDLSDKYYCYDLSVCSAGENV